LPGSDAAILPNCEYSREGRDWPLGVGLEASVTPAAFAGRPRAVVFDGYGLRPLGGSRPVQLE
jgi:hypothetical protein